MKYLEVVIPEKKAYILPIGDIHIGDRAFGKLGKKKLLDYLEWAKKTHGTRIFLNGDIFNVASRISKTDPFSTDTAEYTEAINIFKPYAHLIIGATDGNHEARMIDMFGVSPMMWFCKMLKIPYCGWSAVVRFRVGKRKKYDKSNNRFRGHYFGYFHHTTGGGSTLGSKINRVAKLRDIIEGIDFYCGSHNHQLAAAPQDVFYPSTHGIKKRRIWYIDCGSYLDWNDSYAEKGMMAPTKLGSARIRLNGRNRDVHVSL